MANAVPGLLFPESPAVVVVVVKGQKFRTRLTTIDTASAQSLKTLKLQAPDALAVVLA